MASTSARVTRRKWEGEDGGDLGGAKLAPRVLLLWFPASVSQSFDLLEFVQALLKLTRLSVS
jgi:hypothetical protein